MFKLSTIFEVVKDAMDKARDHPSCTECRHLAADKVSSFTSMLDAIDQNGNRIVEGIVEARLALDPETDAHSEAVKDAYKKLRRATEDLDKLRKRVGERLIS